MYGTNACVRNHTCFYRHAFSLHEFIRKIIIYFKRIAIEEDGITTLFFSVYTSVTIFIAVFVIPLVKTLYYVDYVVFSTMLQMASL